jgi:hypothetical protein
MVTHQPLAKAVINLLGFWLGSPLKKRRSIGFGLNRNTARQLGSTKVIPKRAAKPN